MTATRCTHDTAAPSSQAAAAPVRSPRTSIILAELARQRRFERRERRVKRQQRRRTWARWTGWLAAFKSRWPFEMARAQSVPSLAVTGTTILVYAI